jgi:hypothetical protein
LKIKIHPQKRTISSILGMIKIDKTIAYSSTIASVGQAEAQVPQLTHVAASITLAPSPSLIAPTGHSPSQAPQLTQASVIL